MSLGESGLGGSSLSTVFGLGSAGLGGEFDPIFGLSTLVNYYKVDLQFLFDDETFTSPAVVGGTVGGWKDALGTGLDFEQATIGLRPILRQDSAGHLYLEGNGARFMDIPSSKTQFKFLHNGTGFTSIAAIKANTNGGYIFSNIEGASTTDAGIRWLQRPSDQKLFISIARKVLASFAIDFNQASVWFGGTNTNSSGVSYSTAAGMEAKLDGTQYATQAQLAAPSAADSSFDLMLMALSGASPSNFFDGRLYNLPIFNSVIPADPYQTVVDFQATIMEP